MAAMLKFLLAVFILTVVQLANGQGQKLGNPYSLEYLVDSSDAVVLGKIAQLESRSLQIEVETTLKGETAKSIAVEIAPNEQEAKDLAKAATDGKQVLWFLTHGANGYRLENIDDRSYGLTFSQSTRRIYPIQGVYHIGLNSRLFEAIQREAAARPGRDDRGVSIQPPVWYNMPTFTYPHDKRIEEFAQVWVLPRTGDAERRLTGVRILRHFQSDGNIALLKALVHDPGSIDGSFGANDFKAEAARVLTEWKIDLPPAPPKDTLNPRTVSKTLVRVTVDGVGVDFQKGVSPPVIIGGRTYVRACTISDQLGVKMYTYHLRSSRGVQIDTPTGVIDMPIDSRQIWVGNRPEDVTLPARMIGNEGFFPLRWFVEKSGGTVKWNAKRRTVEITLQGK